MAVWNEDAHPRASAGTATGGQFAAGGSAPAPTTTVSTHPGRKSTAARLVHARKVKAPHQGGGGGRGAKGGKGNTRVRTLQAALNRLGATDGKGAKLAVDGKFGPLTTQAVKKAQAALGLPVDGRVSPKLLHRLAKLKTLPVRAKASVTAAELLFGPSAVWEAWDPELHPRGPGGRFAPLSDAERATRRDSRNAARRTARAGAKAATVAKPHTHESIVAHAATMSDQDLAKLHVAISEMHHTRQVKAAASAAPTPHHGDAHERIRHAYASLAREPGGWVSLADLRDRLGQDLPRDEVDAALKQMLRQRGAMLIPEADQSSLRPRDRAAAVRLGGEMKDLISIEGVGPAHATPAKPAVPSPSGGQQRFAPGAAQRMFNVVTPQDAVRRLQAAKTRQQANDFLAKATKADLMTILDALGSSTHRRGDTKERLRRNAIELAVGRLLDHDAIMRAGR